jgi:hypothetical protein
LDDGVQLIVGKTVVGANGITYGGCDGDVRVADLKDQQARAGPGILQYFIGHEAPWKSGGL